MEVDETPTEGPIEFWNWDDDAKAGYLVINPTELVAETKELPVDLGHSRYRLFVDYDEYGRVLGIEVLS